jgi:uncharacterized protein involved in exopolysaccharide biosynthesis
MTVRGVDPVEETRDQLARAVAFVRRALRSWQTMCCVLVAGGATCAAFLSVRRPTFRSETVIFYSAGVQEDEDGARPDTSRTVMLRLKELLMSRASLDAVARQFDLYPQIRSRLGPVDAVEELRRHLEFRAPGGDTFTLAFTGASPQEAQSVTARLAEVVIAQDSDLRRRQAVVVTDFLETERLGTEDALRVAELGLASFMAAHPRFALDATPLATGAAIRASAEDVALQPSSRSATERSWSFGAPQRQVAAAARAPGGAGDGPAGDAREALLEESRAQAALAAARTSFADLSARYTPAYPDVRAAQAEVDRATGRLAAAMAATGNAGRLPARTASAPQQTPSPTAARSRPTETRPGATVATPQALAGPEHDVVALETEWVKLTRETTEARQHQDQVEAALFKANSVADAEKGDHAVQVTVIDPAFLPQTAVPPGRLTIGALFAGVSLLLAIAAAALRALMDDRVYADRDVERLAPVLVLVPRRAHGARR